MSWLDDLDRELAANSVSRRRARRIRLELADHLACDPDAPLGTPVEVAKRFAAELRAVETRRAVLGSFAALALTAVLLLAAAGTAGPQQNWPRVAGRHGTVVAFSGLGLIAFSQIALVAGVLALVRGVRGHGPGDLRLAQRRAFVGLAAGAGVSACVLVDAAVLRPEPARWLVLALVAGAAPLGACVAAAARVHTAAALTPSGERAPGLAADLPRPVAPHAGRLLAALGAGAVALTVAQGILAEGSLVEGIVRGAIEAAGLVAAVVVLGRLLGLTR